MGMRMELYHARAAVEFRQEAQLQERKEIEWGFHDLQVGGAETGIHLCCSTGRIICQDRQWATHDAK
jgi:hypothetical protein